MYAGRSILGLVPRLTWSDPTLASDGFSTRRISSRMRAGSLIDDAVAPLLGFPMLRPPTAPGVKCELRSGLEPTPTGREPALAPMRVPPEAVLAVGRVIAGGGPATGVRPTNEAAFGRVIVMDCPSGFNRSRRPLTSRKSVVSRKATFVTSPRVIFFTGSTPTP